MNAWVDGKPRGFRGWGGDLSSELAGLVDALGPTRPQGGQVWGMVRDGLL